MIDRQAPEFQSARRYALDAFNTGTTIHLDWSFPTGKFVGKRKYEKAVKRALRWVQRKSKMKFKVWANGEVSHQGFHGHLSVVSYGSLDEQKRLKLERLLKEAWNFVVNDCRVVSQQRAIELEQTGCNLVRSEAQYLADYKDKGNVGYDDFDIITSRWAYVLDHELCLDGFPVVLTRERQRKSYFEGDCRS